MRRGPADRGQRGEVALAADAQIEMTIKRRREGPVIKATKLLI
jgi:hypothetical protein